MSWRRKNRALPLLGCLALIGTFPAVASAETTVTETTRTTTTTTSESVPSSITLSPTGNYMLVDPLTGAVTGVYNPTTGLNNVPSGVMVIDKLSGQLIAAVDSGRLIDIAAVRTSDALAVSINNRQAELQRAISDALAKGAMDTVQATSLRAQLDTIASQEAQSKSDGLLTYSEALALSTSLNNVADQIVSASRSPIVITPLSGARFIVTDGQFRFVDGIAYRKMALERRIDDEYKAGKLSSKQVADLKERLNEIASLESKYRKNGHLSESKEKTLNAKLNLVNSRLEQNIAYINKRRSQLGLRVN